MPSTYSHYYFGQLVYQKLSTKNKGIIDRYRLLYDVGQNGPDILLYHNALKGSPISKQNHTIHQKTGYEFFENIKIKDDAHLAYLFGYICHFVLDASLHPSIENYKNNHHVSHMMIEREFERYLLLKNNLNPFKYDLTSHIKANKQLEKVMKDYVLNATIRDMHDTIIRMKRMYAFTKASSNIKRKMVYLWMDYMKKPYLKDFVFTKEALDLGCEDLYKQMMETVDMACLCIEDFSEGKLEHSIYSKIFG